MAPVRLSREDVLLMSLSVVFILIEIIPTILGGYGYFIDEWYYIACARRLAFGFVDHPPLAPLLAHVDSVGVIRGKYGMSWRNDMRIFLATGPTAPLHAVWGSIRHYE